MDFLAIDRIAILPVFLGAVLLVFVLPVVRLHRRTGQWAVMGPKSTVGAERALYFSLTVWFVLFAAWLASFIGSGPTVAQVWMPSAAIWTAGWFLVACALAMIVVAQAQMGRSWRIGIDSQRTELITRGLYSSSRNPIYSAMLLLSVGLVCVMPGWPTIVLAVTAAFLISIQARLEERHLLAHHGASYREYAARVGRFVPFIGRIGRDSRVMLSAE